VTNFTFGNDLALAELEVTGQAKISATIAQNSLTQITLQRQHFISFERAMCNVDEEVNNHVNDIGLPLKKRA